MDTPTVFDLELADIAQDVVLRRRRLAGDSSPLSESEYIELMGEQIRRARMEFGYEAEKES